MKPQTITEQSLIASINADPANIEIREIYADWLEEHGEDSHGWRLLNACGRVPYRLRYALDGRGWTFRSFSFGSDEAIVSYELEMAGFLDDCDLSYTHPEQANYHRDAFTCLRIAAECIIELEARANRGTASNKAKKNSPTHSNSSEPKKSASPKMTPPYSL